MSCDDVGMKRQQTFTLHDVIAFQYFENTAIAKNTSIVNSTASYPFPNKRLAPSIIYSHLFGTDLLFESQSHAIVQYIQSINQT
jgi:hypothetical protein